MAMSLLLLRQPSHYVHASDFLFVHLLKYYQIQLVQDFSSSFPQSGWQLAA